MVKPRPSIFLHVIDFFKQKKLKKEGVGSALGGPPLTSVSIDALMCFPIGFTLC